MEGHPARFDGIVGHVSVSPRRSPRLCKPYMVNTLFGYNETDAIPICACHDDYWRRRGKRAFGHGLWDWRGCGKKGKGSDVDENNILSLLIVS